MCEGSRARRFSKDASPLHVRELRARAVTIPLDRPIETAAGRVTVSPVVLIDLQCHEGVTGHAYVFCYTPLVLAALLRLLADVASLVQGTELGPGTLKARLDAHFRLVGTKGLVGMAAAGIDMAAWDTLGKAQALPLSRLLGSERQTVSAYVGIRSMRPVEAALEAESAGQAGFRAVKVKLGHPTLSEDLALVRAVRSAVGGGVEIMVDYNQSLSLTEARIRGHALEDEAVAWIEEPLSVEEDTGHAALARELRTPVQLGENWWGPEEVARGIAAHVADCVTFDVARIGGITGWLAASQLAREANLPVSSHRYPEVSASLLAATPTAHWLEYVDTVSPVLADPVRAADGCLIVPSLPGIGVSWNEQAVARFLVS